MHYLLLIIDKLPQCVCVCVCVGEISAVDEFDHKHLDKDVDYFKTVVRSAHCCSHSLDVALS